MPDDTDSQPGSGPAHASPYDGDDLSVVIPAYNEAEGITTTLKNLCRALPKAEIIVIDDGSSDATAEAASDVPGVRVISHGFNRGYGAAIKTGMRSASRKHIAWFDADNEHRVEDLIKMMMLIRQKDLAAVLGRRRRAGVTPVRVAGKAVIRAVARSLGLNVGRDLNCGLRVFRRIAIMPYISLLPDSYSASTTSTMILAERQYPVEFFDIDTNPRIGQSKVQIRHGFGTIAIILRTITLFAPLRIFFGTGLPIVIVGATYSLLVAILKNEGLPAAGVLSVLGGLLLCCFGLLADQISQMRLIQLSELRAGLSDSPEVKDYTRNDT